MTAKRAIVKPWSGRFSTPTDAYVERFTESVSFDQRLYHYDIKGSIAHVRMLAQVKVLSRRDEQRIIKGLRAIEQRIAAGRFTWKTRLEDVHMNIETALVEAIGEVGKKVHTGRSRNDQSLTMIRLFMKDELSNAIQILQNLIGNLLFHWNL